MTIKELVDIIRQDASAWAIIFIIVSTLIEITPIKINPISSFFSWISKKLNKDIIDRLDKMESKLDEHIEQSEVADIRLRREKILSFGTSCINNHKHTKEEFEFIISECDKYESYCHKNNIPNGVASATIAEIRRIYSDCLRNNSFA